MLAKVTTERIYIDEVDYYGLDVVENHLQRYKWATSKLDREDCVLDAGCGSGYGSLMLTKTCRYVVGFDKSVEAVGYAKFKQSKNGIGRLDYHLADATTVNLPYVFDKVVCIEMIEHLTEEQQDMAMEQFKKMMQKNGQLFITTPEKKGNKRTEFHVKEFSKEEFDAFLKKHFSTVKYESADDFKIKGDFILATCWGQK